jgi:hypothetical protein
MTYMVTYVMCQQKKTLDEIRPPQRHKYRRNRFSSADLRSALCGPHARPSRICWPAALTLGARGR